MDYRDNEQKGSNVDHEVMELRGENALLYYKPSISCLIKERQGKKNPFSNQAVAPGNIGRVVINCDEFVNGPGSYLQVSCVVQFPAGGGDMQTAFGTYGSILNLFQSVKLYHRSGQILEDLPNRLAQLMTIKRFYKYNAAEREQLDAILNVNQLPPAAGAGARAVTFSASIPLSLMLGSFEQTNQLIPPAFISGAILELGIYPDLSIFATAGYTVSNINMNLSLDTVSVFDSAKKQINEETMDVKASGIQFCYDTNFYTGSSQITAGATVGYNLNFDVQQANTVTKNVFFVIADRVKIETAVAASGKYPFYGVVSSLQFRCGSQYYPNQPMTMRPAPSVTATAGSDNSQAFQNTVMAFDAQNRQFGSFVNSSGIDNLNYTGIVDAGVGGIPGHFAVYGMLLDRGPQGSVQYSGVPTNNSRLLNINATIVKSAGDDAQANDIYVWTTTARVANCIGDSLILDR